MDSPLTPPVPFPTLSRQIDEPEVKTGNNVSVHSRVHSSPTSPNPWIPSHPKSKKKLSVTSTGSPRRKLTPLTPPLTPSSSFNSASGTDSSDRDNDAESNVPSTPPESPWRPTSWNIIHTGKRKSIAVFPGVFMSPSSIAESDASGEVKLRRFISQSNFSSPSPVESVDSVTPRVEKTSVLDDRSDEDGDGNQALPIRRMNEILSTFRDNVQTGRFVLLRNVPAKAPVDLIKAGLPNLKTLKGIFVRFQQSHGVVVLAYFDVRDALDARRSLDGKRISDVFDAGLSLLDLSDGDGDKKMEAVSLGTEQLDEVIEKSSFVASTVGTFFITVENVVVPPSDLQNLLTGFGTLMHFSAVGSAEHQKFLVEYWDVRDSERAYNALKDRTFLGAIFRTTLPGEGSGLSLGVTFPTIAGPAAPTEVDLTSPVKGSLMLPDDYTKRRPRSVSASESTKGGRDVVSRAHPRDGRGRENTLSQGSPTHPAARLKSLVAQERNQMQPPPSPSRRRSLSVDPERDIVHPPQGFLPPAPAHNSWPVPTLGSSLGLSTDYLYGHPPMPPYASRYPHVPSHAAYHIGMPPPTPQLFQHAPMPQQQQALANDGFLHSGHHPHHVRRNDHQWAPQYATQPPPGLHSPHHPPPSAGMECYLPVPPPLPQSNVSSHLNGVRSAPHTPRRFHHQHQYSGQRRGHGQGQDNDEEPGELLVPLSSASDVTSFKGYSLSSGNAAPITTLSLDDPPSPTDISAPLPGSPQGNGGIQPKNQLDLNAIEKGIDTRTTVMIKNIPNKMTDKDLMDFIARVCPRRIDFLYLRMDFQNGCNVGYAFVNFITVQDLLHFASTQLGVKWNMYSSEKVLQMSYANYQGKEALVEKFKNSCIMDEREAWRPKIFYSAGPQQGLPECFPPPTHLRRKERSAHNRGALFVPGPGSASGHHHNHNNHHGGRGGNNQHGAYHPHHHQGEYQQNGSYYRGNGGNRRGREVDDGRGGWMSGA